MPNVKETQRQLGPEQLRTLAEVLDAEWRPYHVEKVTVKANERIWALYEDERSKV